MNINLVVDLAHCNLKCRMCPRSEMWGPKNTATGIMDVHLFKKIVHKIIEENVIVDNLYVGNWGEASINPHLSEIIEIAKINLHPKTILINTNLTHLIEPERLLLSGVTNICISISGMCQEIYSKNHSGGNIKKVLENISILSSIKKNNKLEIPVLMIVFHRYNYNHNDEVQAKNFCRDNQVIFSPRQPYICGIEQVMIFHENREIMVDFYQQFIDVDKEIKGMRFGSDECLLRDSQIVINFDGQLYRCCWAYDETNFIGNFFDYPIKDIPKIKSNICNVCKNTLMNHR